ncbi:MAG: hypothetical protein IPM46_00245 [Flavobacteriales bacterium]|nr:hypothetical protein [Flavobacteriales bacterium]
MILAMGLLYSGSIITGGGQVNSSNAVAGTLFDWQRQVTEHTSLRAVNERLVAETRNGATGLRPGGQREVRSVPPPAIASRSGSTDCIGQGGERHLSQAAQPSPSTRDIERRAARHGRDWPDGIVGVVHDASERFTSVIRCSTPW